LEIRILCDKPVDPISAQPRTCYVTVDLPYPFDVLAQTSLTLADAAGVLGFQPLVLPAQVGVKSALGGNEIDLSVQAEIIGPLLDLLLSGASSRFLAHITLKGKFIWGQEDATMYLDGAAYGIARTEADGTHIGLRLPQSGDGTPGSDFEMWFWLTRPVWANQVTFSRPAITAGQTSNGTVFLNAFAPPGGAAIALSPSSPIATLTPNPVTIPEGTLSGPFLVSNTLLLLPPGEASTSLGVTAIYGVKQATGNLTINRQINLTGLSFSQNRTFGSVSIRGTVTLDAPAPATPPTIITLTGNQTSVTVPGTVTVKPNFSSGEFTLQTPLLQIHDPAVVLIVTASYPGSNSVQGTLTMNLPLPI